VLPERAVRPRTRAGRLASLDAWLCAEAPELLDGRGAIVDFGFGLTPVTTLELAQTVRAVNPALRVVGVEREAHAEVPGLELVVGDTAALGPISVLRAMNVVRGYREDEVDALHVALGAGVIDGGLVLEGSTDTEGHVTVTWLLRKRAGALVREALLFHTDFTRGFSPWLFRDWLPRDLRRRATPGTPIHTLLSNWNARVVGESPRERFESSLQGDVESTDWERAHGFARWRLRGD
jgi:hypothetical protein